MTAFIGPSGCGKSTFLRTLNRMHEVIPGAHVEGEVLIDGNNLYGPGVDPVLVRRQVGMVFQRPNPFPTMSIRENVLAGVKLNNRADLEVRRRRRWSSSRCRAPTCGTRSRTASTSPARASPAASSSASASRGRSRSQPEVILMDEPCSALDPISTLAIEDLIEELKQEYTIVIVTHNMQQASRVSRPDRVLQHRGHRQAGQAHRVRRHHDDLLEPVGAGHRGLRLRPLRLSRD